MKKESIFGKYLYFFILSFTIVFISWASPIKGNDTWTYIIFLFLVFIFFFSALMIDKIVFFITAFWFVINILSAYFNEVPFSIVQVSVYLLVFLIPYLLMKVIGNRFFFDLERFIFYLSLIAIPIFLLNILFIDFFASLASFFEPVTYDFFNLKYPYYWYGFIYTHDIVVLRGAITFSDLRNSGFMWEPGAFAMMIVISILFNWYTLGIKFSKKVIVYFIALLTTFSTTGYICLLLLLSIYAIKKGRGVLVIIMISLIFLFQILKDTDFVGGKINSYIEDNNTNQYGNYSRELNYNEVNRLTIFLLKSEAWLQYPLGYGLFEPKLLVRGVNGLANILLIWGVFGFVFLVISIYKFFKLIDRNNNNLITLALSALIIFILFFSNPVSTHPVLFFMVLAPYIYNKEVFLPLNKEEDFAPPTKQIF